MRLIDADALNGYKFGLISPYAQNLFHKTINEAPTIDYKRLLEQEPCADAISRQAVLSHIKTERGNGHEQPFDYVEADVIRALPPVKPQYTDAEIQKMQDLESAEIQKAYEIGKAENIEVLDKIRSEIVHLHDWAFSREEILRIIDKYKESEDKEGGTQHDD